MRLWPSSRMPLARWILACMVMGMPCFAWPATVPATFAHSGGQWTLTWTSIHCSFFDFFNATSPPRSWELTVDGLAYSGTFAGSNFIGGPPDIGTVDLTAPHGALTRVTIDGATSFACGADLFTLPGHGPPAAATAIPALSDWGLVMTAALVGIASVVRLRRGLRKGAARTAKAI